MTLNKHTSQAENNVPASSAGLPQDGAQAQKLPFCALPSCRRRWLRGARSEYVQALLGSAEARRLRDDAPAAALLEILIDLDRLLGGHGGGHCILVVLDADRVDSVPLVGFRRRLAVEDVAQVAAAVVACQDA